jgi:hypothetical protein
VGFGHAFEVPHQEIVNALASAVLIDANGFNLGCWRRGFALYNDFHWGCAVSGLFNESFILYVGEV